MKNKNKHLLKLVNKENTNEYFILPFEKYSYSKKMKKFFVKIDGQKFYFDKLIKFKIITMNILNDVIIFEVRKFNQEFDILINPITKKAKTIFNI